MQAVNAQPLTVFGRIAQTAREAVTALINPLDWRIAPTQKRYTESYGTQGSVSVAALNGKLAPIERKSNVQRLRAYAKYSWAVQTALDWYRDAVARAAISVVAYDDARPMNEAVRKEIVAFLGKSNPKGESYTAVKEMALEDMLVVGHGAIEFQVARNGRPYDFFALDAGRFGFLKKWDGNLKQPRYVYQSADGQGKAATLLDMEAMVLFNRQRSFDLLGISHVEVLDQQINALLAGDEFLLTQIANPAPNGALNLGESAQRADVEAVRSQIEEVKHAFIVMGGSAAASFLPFNAGEREMRVLDRQLWYLTAVSAVFKLPMQVFGQYQNETNRASMKELLASKTEGPGASLARIEEVENAAIAAKFGDKAEHNCWITYNVFGFKDETAQANNAATRLAGRAWTSFNEERGQAGRDKIKLGVADAVLVEDGANGLVTLEYVQAKNEKLLADINKPPEPLPTPVSVPPLAKPAKPAKKDFDVASKAKAEDEDDDTLATEEEAAEWLNQVLPTDADGLASAG